MKLRLCKIAALLVASSLWGAAKTSYAQTVAPPAPQTLSAATILSQTQVTTEAQLKSLAAKNRNPIDWVGGTMWAGLAEFSQVSNRPLEADAVRQMGEKANWKLLQSAKSPFHADNVCIAQAYLDVYAQNREPRTIEPLKADLDALVEHLNAPVDEKTRLTWWWCDALFMAPAVLARMSDLTGDPKYIDAMDKEWWRVAEKLYDPQEHLFYRDSRFFKLTTKNGKKVFWSRGNGWVMGGLVRVLTWMPRDYPSRPKYEQMLRDMAAKIVSLQGKDGAWRTSLLDAEEFSQPETSGTAFYCYAMAWGVNNGILPRETYAPAATKSWTALMANRRADGLPGWVQEVGDRPATPQAQGTQLYATGGITLAATEMMKLATSGAPLSIPAQ